jgi:hypothetical protein
MRRLLAAGALTAVLLPILAVPVLAAGLDGGCILQISSFDAADATGTTLDATEVTGPIAGGRVGTEANPFQVDPEGSVSFLFKTPTVFENNHWAVYVQGLPIAILQGSDDNPGDTDERGVVTLGEAVKALPFRVVGTFLVSGDLYGNDDAAHCHGEGFVQVLGDPIGTVPWILALVLLVLGGVGLIVATPFTSDWETDQTGGDELHSGPMPR